MAARQDPGGDPDKEERRRRSLEADQERDKPKPRAARAPSRDAALEKAREEGGKLMGPRLAAAGLAATDQRLKDSTVRAFALFLWEYQPGKVYRRSSKFIGQAVGLAERTWRQAFSQLKRHGYIRRCQGGWVSPIVELRLMPEKRAWNEQRSFDFMVDWDSRGAAKYLRLVESNRHILAGSPESQPASTCRSTGKDVPVNRQAHAGPSNPRPLRDPFQDPGRGPGASQRTARISPPRKWRSCHRGSPTSRNSSSSGRGNEHDPALEVSIPHPARRGA